MKPKLFISYSWSSKEHETWVLSLATELAEDYGIDVQLDKWDLKPGDDAFHFMESMVTDDSISKVLMIFDKVYVEKANNRSGGAGTETQIISSELYNKTKQNKFAAAVVEKDPEGQYYIPTYYKSRIFIDFTDPTKYSSSLEQVVRWIYDEPLYKKPEIGNKPKFLSDDQKLAKSSTIHLRLIRNIHQGKSSRIDLIDYFNQIVSELGNFKMCFKAGEESSIVKEKLLANIDSFLPLRNEILEVLKILAQYSEPDFYMNELHSLFERLADYMFRKPEKSSYTDVDNDNYKFLIRELFLYCIAIMLKYKKFSVVELLLNEYYYVQARRVNGLEALSSYVIFDSDNEAFRIANNANEQKYYDYPSKLLIDRLNKNVVTFDDFFQADFILYFRSCVEAKNEDSFFGMIWVPTTTIYKRRSNVGVELIAKARSIKFFEKIKGILGVESVDDIETLIEFTSERNLSISWGFETASIGRFVDIKLIATK